MNTNEVIASLATETLGSPVHPNDHVNASQSSNDVFPSAIHVAATKAIVRDLVPALEHLAGSLERKAEEFAEVVKSGRTHLMDATPVTLGQEFGGYPAAGRSRLQRLQASLPRIREPPPGGPPVGPAIPTPPRFPPPIFERVAPHPATPGRGSGGHAGGVREGVEGRRAALPRRGGRRLGATAAGTGTTPPPGSAAEISGGRAAERALPLSEARDHFEAQSSRDAL